MKRQILTALFAMFSFSSAQAQNSYYWPAPERQGISEGVRASLPVGTEVRMRTLTQISTKDNSPGDRVYLEVAENVYARDQIVIPVGSPVLAEVAAMQRNGHFGKKGKIAIRLIEVQTPNGPVRLMGSSSDEGKSGTAASVATIVLISPLGFLIHGTSALIPPGTPVSGQLADYLKFTYYPAARGQSQSAQADMSGPAASNFNF